MKKLFFTLLCIAAFIPLWAQDIIVTTFNERIDAKITEVSETEVKYKQMDNLDGPTFVISTNKIASVIYKNGSVQTFKQANQTLVSQNNTQPQNTVTLLEGDAAPAFQPGIEIKKDNDDFYWLGNYRMEEKVYFDYIQKNCQDAWESYKKGRTLFRAGWGLFGAGSGLFLCGIGLLSAGNWGVYTVKYNKNTGQIIDTSLTETELACFQAGAVLFSFGSASLSASVPLLVIGAIKKNNSHEVYNESCAAKQTPLTLNLQAGTNGIGLALNF